MPTAVPITFISYTSGAPPVALVKLAFGIPLLLYDTLKVILRVLCPWCPTITIQPDRGVRPYNPNPY